MLRHLSICALIVAAMVHPALAQPSPLQGAWTWLSPGQGGMDRNTVMFQADGTYVRASQLANGSTLRYWGSYNATQLSPTQIGLQSHTQGWLPTSLCAQAPGFPPRCSPAPHPPEMSFTLQFTSPSTMVTQGVVLSRDSSPFLLQQRVPQQEMMTVSAPVQPNMQQPVMPTLHPYVTPNGPGNQIANANHAGAQHFINENMRGCYTGTDGRLYGCQQ